MVKMQRTFKITNQMPVVAISSTLSHMLEQTNKNTSVPAGKNREDFLVVKHTAQPTQAGLQL